MHSFHLFLYIPYSFLLFSLEAAWLLLDTLKALSDEVRDMLRIVHK